MFLVFLFGCHPHSQAHTALSQTTMCQIAISFASILAKNDELLVDKIVNRLSTFQTT